MIFSSFRQVPWQLVFDLIEEFVDEIESCVRGHKLVAIVDDKCAHVRVFVSTCLETTPNLNVDVLDVHWVLVAVELRPLAHLDETCFTHGLLDDDVEHLAHCLAILPVGLVDVCWIDNELAFTLNQKVHLASIQL